MGMPARVALVDATAITGGLTLELLELDGKPMPKGGGRRRSKGGKGRKMGAARSKAAKHKKKVKRKQRG